MIRVFYGADTFRSREAFRSARKQIADQTGVPVVLLRDEALTPVSLHTAASGQTLFSASPPLAVERLTAFSGAHGASIAQMLRTFPRRRTLLVWEEGVPNVQGVVWKALKIAGKLEEFTPLSEAHVRSWVQKKLDGTGRTLEPAAAEALIERGGADLWRLSSELEKLILLKDAGPITEEDVAELTSAGVEAEVFATVRAIVRGDARVALMLLAEARKIGEEPRRLFFLLVREVKHLLLVRDLLDRGEHMTPWVVASTLRLPRNAAEALLETSQRTSTSAVQALFDRCVVSYYHLNVGRAEADEVLETLALKRFEGSGV